MNTREMGARYSRCDRCQLTLRQKEMIKVYKRNVYVCRNCSGRCQKCKVYDVLVGGRARYGDNSPIHCRSCTVQDAVECKRCNASPCLVDDTTGVCTRCTISRICHGCLCEYRTVEDSVIQKCGECKQCDLCRTYQPRGDFVGTSCNHCFFTCHHCGVHGSIYCSNGKISCKGCYYMCSTCNSDLYTSIRSPYCANCSKDKCKYCDTYYSKNLDKCPKCVVSTCEKCGGRGANLHVEDDGRMIHDSCRSCDICYNRIGRRPYIAENGQKSCNACICKHIELYCQDPMKQVVLCQVMCPFMPSRPMFGSTVCFRLVRAIQVKAEKRHCSIRCPGCEQDCVMFDAVSKVTDAYTTVPPQFPQNLMITPEEFMVMYPITLSTYRDYVDNLDSHHYQKAWFSILMRSLCNAIEHVKTECCGIDMCYKCKMRMDNNRRHVCTEQVVMNADVRGCPKCNLQFIKTEGCNSIRCPCGYKFAYALSTVVS